MMDKAKAAKKNSNRGGGIQGIRGAAGPGDSIPRGEVWEKKGGE